jgi:hypothetical protein
MGEPTTSRPTVDELAAKQRKYDAAKAEAARMVERVQHWRARAETAEAELERLRAALQRVADWKPYGGCGTTTMRRLGYEGPRDAARAALDPDAVGGRDA